MERERKTVLPGIRQRSSDNAESVSNKPGPGSRTVLLLTENKTKGYPGPCP